LQVETLDIFPCKIRKVTKIYKLILIIISTTTTTTMLCYDSVVGGTHVPSSCVLPNPNPVPDTKDRAARTLQECRAGSCHRWQAGCI